MKVLSVFCKNGKCSVVFEGKHIFRRLNLDDRNDLGCLDACLRYFYIDKLVLLISGSGGLRKIKKLCKGLGVTWNIIRPI